MEEKERATAFDGREYEERSSNANGQGYPLSPGTKIAGNPNADIWQ